MLSYIAKELVDELKGSFAPIESDMKDAKRRISVAKGPKKKKASAQAEVQDDVSSASCPEEGDDEDDDQ